MDLQDIWCCYSEQPIIEWLLDDISFASNIIEGLSIDLITKLSWPTPINKAEENLKPEWVIRKLQVIKEKILKAESQLKESINKI